MNELRKRLLAAKAKADAIVAAADKDSNGILSEEQQKEFDAALAEFEATKKEIDRREKLSGMAADAKEAPARATLPAQVRSESEAEREKTGGFKNVAEFGRAVQAACLPGGGARIDDRLLAGSALDINAAPTNFHRETGDSGNIGYLVPPQFREQIWGLVFDDTDLLSMTDMEPTNSNMVEYLADESTPWGGSGIVAKWRSEGTQMDPSRLSMNKKYVPLEELYAFVLATGELLDDAPRLNNRLTVKAAEAIRWKIAEAIMYGTGVGQPAGYFNSDAAVIVAAEGGQSADTILVKNLAKMYSRLLPSSLGRCIWVANSDILPQLIDLQIGTTPVYTAPNGGIKDTPGGLVLGRPVIFHELAKTLGDKGDIQLIDPKGYYSLIKNSGVQFDTSIHLYFDYNIQAFRWMFRFGGRPHLSAPVTPANGNNTKSHFVLLAARA